MSFNFAPKGWALCNGQLLPINQNQALFSLLGTMYGGNGQTNFALPNLQGRVPLHIGSGHIQGESAGAESVTLNSSQMPQHTHAVRGSSNVTDVGSPANGFWASGGQQIYSNSLDSAMAPQATTNVGGSQAHENRSPFLALSIIIALQGIFPSRN